MQRVLSAPNAREASSRFHVCRIPETDSVFLFIIPGMICFALAKSGLNADIQHQLIDANGNLIREKAQAAFPMLVIRVASRYQGNCGGRTTGRADEAPYCRGCNSMRPRPVTMGFLPKMKQCHACATGAVGRIATVVMVVGLLWSR